MKKDKKPPTVHLASGNTALCGKPVTRNAAEDSPPCRACMDEAGNLINKAHTALNRVYQDVHNLGVSMWRDSEGLHPDDHVERALRAQGRYVSDALYAILDAHKDVRNG